MSKRVTIAIVGIAVLFSYLILFKLSQYTFLSIDVSTSHNTQLQVFWSYKDDYHWLEKNSVRVDIKNKKSNYIIILPAAKHQINDLRIDPSNRTGITTAIRSVAAYGLFSLPLKIDNKNSFAQVQHNDQVGNFKFNKHRISFQAAHKDPQLYIENNNHLISKVFVLTLGTAVLASMILLFLFSIPALGKDLIFVPFTMLMIFVLVAVMAFISKKNVHPDEMTHINNAVYYSEHYAPALACSDDALFTYTTYGVSRLDNREIAYYLGGRYLRLFSAVPALDYLKLRYLNVFLFLLLTILAFKNKTFRYIALPILLTPQIWYVFSYYNSDALSLFAVFALAYQIFARESALRRLLSAESSKRWLFWVAVIAITVALQFWVKLNFFFYPLFLSMLAFIWLLFCRGDRLKMPNLTVIIALLLGVSLFSGWEIWRHSVNDFQLAEKSYECRELTAGKWYKPSTALEKTAPTFRLRDKGVGLFEMLDKYDFTKRTFYTGLGAYGYTNYINAEIHYQVVSVFILLFVAYLVFRICCQGTIFNYLSVLAAALAMLGLFGASAFNGWTQDLQAQGRYLLVYLPILGTLIAIHKHRFNHGLLLLFVLMPLLMGLWSFIGNGLMELPNIS